MKTPNRVLMSQARGTLKGKWGVAIVGILIYMAVSVAVTIPFSFLATNIRWTGNIVSVFISGPLFFGITLFFLTLSRNQATTYGQLFEGFRSNILRSIGTYLLMTLYIILWTLLLIVPGIIASLAYSQVFYILVDDRTIGISDALRKSKQMMNGNKWKLFCLGLRFFMIIIPMIIIFILIAVGIHAMPWLVAFVPILLLVAFFWLGPYIQTTMAKFYEDVKNQEAPAVEVLPAA